MTSSHLEMIDNGLVEEFGPIADAKSPDLTAHKSQEQETVLKVNQWLDTQLSLYVTGDTVWSSQSRKSSGSKTSGSSTSAKKTVHWAAKLEDFVLYPDENDSKLTQNEEKRPKVSNSKRRMKYPPVPELPRSRRSRSTPRPERLLTPDLPDLDHGEFCTCCDKSARKMNSQMLAAQQHIAGAKFSVMY